MDKSQRDIFYTCQQCLVGTVTFLPTNVAMSYYQLLCCTIPRLQVIRLLLAAFYFLLPLRQVLLLLVLMLVLVFVLIAVALAANGPFQPGCLVNLSVHSTQTEGFRSREKFGKRRLRCFVP